MSKSVPVRNGKVVHSSMILTITLSFKESSPNIILWNIPRAAIRQWVIFGNAPKSWTKSKTLLIPNLETPGNAPISSIASQLGLYELTVLWQQNRLGPESRTVNVKLFGEPWPGSEFVTNKGSMRFDGFILNWGQLRSFSWVKRSVELLNENLLRG